METLKVRMSARLLCAMIALCMLVSGISLAEPMPAAPVAEYEICVHDGRVTLIDGDCAGGPVTGFEDAARVVDSVLERLGGDGSTQLDEWRTLTDAFGNRYYVFQQMYNGTTVLGGAVKVITDAEGNMLGLTSSIEANPSEGEAEGIDAAEAERIVLDNALAQRQQALTLVPGRTGRMILPKVLEVDIEAEEDEGSRYVWVVYTDNPDCNLNVSSDLPYLAHYVTLSGEYLYSLPTIMPGDEAGSSGFDASYVFEFMEPVDYTGYVDLSTGGEREISVTVMRDKRTGMYYLGDLERRIVVADCWEFLYGGNRVVLESSTDNLEWDQVGLLTLYNYCRAYDYYREIGWIGGDGKGTPILILNDFCDIKHVPVDNAAYVGGYMGWQIFLASQGNDFSQCLDVLAHEFTHCVTGSVMTYNAYMNDYGAINEAMSDIQGKTCQILMEGRENVSWTIADRSLYNIRSMDDPHRFQQPEFTWDIFYKPSVKTPTDLNDRGGVHSNSSLLNRLAWLLYDRGGMTPEEGRAFWFTVDCAMVPGTDNLQLSEILPWALRIAGLEKYDTELRRALDATRLGVEAIPDAFDEDRALLTLSLPDNEIFDDEQWVLMLYVVNIDRLFDMIGSLVGNVLAGDFSGLPGFLQSLLSPDGGEDFVIPEDEDLFLWLYQELVDWAKNQFEGSYYNDITNAGQDGRTMRLVTIPGHALPMLMHAVFNETTSELEEMKLMVYLGGLWLDVTSFGEEPGPDGGEGEISEEYSAFLDRILDRMIACGDNRGFSEFLDLFFVRIEGGTLNTLGTEGLESANPGVMDVEADEEPVSAEASQPRKSRPKLDKAKDAA